MLGVGNGDAGELAHGGPAEVASFEGLLGRGKLLEGFGDAQFFLRRARAVAEQALDVLVERGEAEVDVCRGAQRGEEAAGFLCVSGGSFARQAC
jgi:hypothetical protein